MASVSSPSIAIERSDLPVLPTGWRWVQFSETCDRVSVGHVGPTTEFFTDAPDGIHFLRSQNVRPGKLELENALAITPDFHRKLKKSRLQAGDILFVRVGANRGDCCVVPTGVGELNCANIVFARPKQPTGFHAYFFQSDLGQNLLLSASVGAAQGVINTGSVATMPVPFPPLPVQQRIAGILSAYDELIENSQRRIKILEAMARALYREWFVHFRFPGHENHPRVASPLGEIPQGWEVKKLRELITYSRRATKPGAHLEERRYVPIDCLPPKSLALLEAKPIEEAQSSLQLFEKGDILFGAMRPYFHKVVVAPFPGVTRTTCFVFKPVRPEWHAFATMTAFDEVTVAYANAHSQGATIPYAVWDSSLSEMPLALPSTEVLQRFEDVVAPMLSRIEQSFFALGNLRRTRDLLLPRLLSGQIEFEAEAA